jgi:predicted O-linked N-acetylglucosamine transferase (SPINDLY family)
MPHAYHILDHKQYYPLKKPIPRRDLNLPEGKFLFCNHANNYRLDPEIFDVWADIVKNSPNSALVLKWFNNVTGKL